MKYNSVTLENEDGEIIFNKNNGETKVMKLIRNQCGFETVMKLSKDQSEQLYFQLKEYFEK